MVASTTDQLRVQIEKLERETRHPPVPKQDYDTVVIVSGLPIVSKDKVAKLESHLQKLFSQCGVVDFAHVPFDESKNESLGYALVDFEDVSSAVSSLSIFNNYRFDSNNTIFTINYEIFEKMQNPNQTQEKEKIPEYVNVGDIKEFSRNQKVNNYLTTFSDQLDFNIYTNADDAVELEPMLRIPMSNLSSSSVQFWSPQGTYLIATARDHFNVYVTLGSENLSYKLFREVEIEGELNFVSVSPCERYILAYSSVKSLIKIVLYNILGGITITKYTDIDSNLFNERKWSSCGSYFAFMQKNALVILESQTGQMLDNAPIDALNIHSFEWSPCNIRNYDETSVAIYHLAPEYDVANLKVIQVPSRKVLATKTFVNVYRCDVRWQEGHTALDYISIVSQHFVKIKKLTPQNDSELEQGEVGYKLTGVDYTLDVIRLSGKKTVTMTQKISDLTKNDSYTTFCWEPIGLNHICVVFSSKVEIFMVDKSSNRLSLVKKLDFDPEVNVALFTDCIWHPFGHYFILLDKKSSQGNLAFVDGHTGAILETNKFNNYINAAQWDPSGRNFLTANLTDISTMTKMSVSQDTQIHLWCISGRLSASHRAEVLGFCQWRPQSKLLLSEKEIEKIRSTIEDYKDEFMEEDRLKEQYDSAEHVDNLKSSFKGYIDWMHKINSLPKWPLGEMPSSDDENFEDKHVVLESELKV